MKRFNLFLAKQQLKQLRLLSITTGLSIAEHIRRAVDKYLDGINA